MRVAFTTYAAAFQCPGGGEIQLMKSRDILVHMGIEVVLFDPWTHRLKDFDILHMFSVQGGSYNLIAYAKNIGMPVVVSPIIWISEEPNDYPLSEIRFILEKADIICPNSQLEADMLALRFKGFSTKMHVTHNAVCRSFFERQDQMVFRREYNVFEDFVLYVGNIEHRKNLLRLAEATVRLGVRLVIVGAVRDESYFNEVKRVCMGNLTIVPYIQNDSAMLRSAYAACSCFALPSLLETPGLAAMEAAAAGCKLVVTERGSTKEYFGDSALYVDPYSVDDIQEKLRLALMSGTNHHIDLPNTMRAYSWENTGSQIYAAYKIAGLQL
jgi:glycosyltransferase involved in cell wall biosynthesis